MVWSINLLSFGNAEESIMRLESPNIAYELIKSLERTGTSARGSQEGSSDIRILGLCGSSSDYKFPDFCQPVVPADKPMN